MASNWDESKHPRVQAGSSKGGQFTRKSGVEKGKEENALRKAQAALDAGARMRSPTAFLTPVQMAKGEKQDLLVGLIRHWNAPGAPKLSGGVVHRATGVGHGNEAFVIISGRRVYGAVFLNPTGTNNFFVVNKLESPGGWVKKSNLRGNSTLRK